MYYHYNTYLSILDFFSQVTFSSYNYFTDVLKLCKLDQLFSLFLPYRIIFASPIITCLYSYYAICFVSSFGLCPDSCCGYGIRSYDGGGRLPPSFSSLSPRVLSFVSLHVLALAATSSRIHLSVKYINFKFHKIVCHFVITRSLLAIKLNENKKAFQ